MGWAWPHHWFIHPQCFEIVYSLLLQLWDYGGIKGWAAVWCSSDGRKSVRNHQPTCTDWSFHLYLVVTCSKWSIFLSPWRLLLSIKLCSTYFFSESKCNRLSKIRLALGMGQYIWRKKDHNWSRIVWITSISMPTMLWSSSPQLQSCPSCPRCTPLQKMFLYFCFNNWSHSYTV